MTVATDLPATPRVGLAFRPDTTDSIGTVTKVLPGGRQGPTVQYTYAHEPDVTHTRPWHEVRNLGWVAT
jgi:hypothetical protein